MATLRHEATPKRRSQQLMECGDATALCPQWTVPIRWVRIASVLRMMLCIVCFCRLLYEIPLSASAVMLYDLEMSKTYSVKPYKLFRWCHMNHIDQSTYLNHLCGPTNEIGAVALKQCDETNCFVLSRNATGLNPLYIFQPYSCTTWICNYSQVDCPFVQLAFACSLGS